jgi:hypothetical protein
MAVYAICTGSTRNEAFVPVIFRFENFSGKIRFHKIPLFQRVLWWARQGLNLRPHPCEGCALPLSYAPAAPELSAVRSRASNQVRGR